MMTEQISKHERTCVGCGKRAAPDAMVRLVLGPAGQIAVDAAGGGFGRGAHVHPSLDCVAKAARGGLARAFKTKVVVESADGGTTQTRDVDAKSLGTAIREAYERRAAGLVMGARRAGHLELGADAAAQAYATGAPLVVLAADAGTVAKRFDAAVAAGRAACFGTKAALGEMFGTGEIAVFAVRHRGVAEALSQVLLVAAGAGER